MCKHLPFSFKVVIVSNFKFMTESHKDTLLLLIGFLYGGDK